MKKRIFTFYLLITILTFSFYSCASNTKADEVDEIIEEVPVVESEIEQTEDYSETETAKTESTESIVPESYENNESEPEDENSSSTYEIPEDFNEPDVFEIEIPEESEIIDDSEQIDEALETDTDELSAEISEELITVDELDDLNLETETSDSEEINVEPENSINIGESTEMAPESETESAAEIDSTFDIEIPTENIDEMSKNDDSQKFEQDYSDDFTVIDENSSDETNEDDILPEEEIDPIIPSRKVTIKRGEYLDVIYPGNGWVYVGLVDGSKDITYSGRKLGTENTTFTLIGKNPGTKIVHFYKTDILTNEYIDDYLQIEVLSERTTSKVHQIAPDYADIVPHKLNSNNLSSFSVSDLNKKTDLENSNNIDDDIIFIEETDQKSNPVSTTIAEKKDNIKIDNRLNQTETNESSENVQIQDYDVILQNSYKEYNEKNYENALKLIEDYINLAAKKLDEAYYLKGQIYEAQSGIKNINNAVKAYDKIVTLYPTSKYWDKANKRIIYLKRFYLEVR